jgi:hypothetical protein
MTIATTVMMPQLLGSAVCRVVLRRFIGGYVNMKAMIVLIGGSQGHRRPAGAVGKCVFGLHNAMHVERRQYGDAEGDTEYTESLPQD